MPDQTILVGLAGLLLSVLTYLAGQRRAEMRYAKEDHAARVNGVVDTCMVFRRSTPPETGGLDGLQRAGVATLLSNAEVQKVIDRIVAHGDKHPLGRDHETVFQGVDLLKVFKYAADRRINFLSVQIADVIRDNGAKPS